jgi:hypothetical protein
VFDIASSVRWSIGLSITQRIIKTTVHSAIGIAPAQLVFASHTDLDRGILFEWATPDEQAAADPTAHTNDFIVELFRAVLLVILSGGILSYFVQAQVLETALAVQLAQDAQQLAAR